MTNAGWKEALIREVTSNSVRLSEVIERLGYHEQTHRRADEESKRQRFSIFIAIGSSLIALLTALLKYG